MLGFLEDLGWERPAQGLGDIGAQGLHDRGNLRSGFNVFLLALFRRYLRYFMRCNEYDVREEEPMRRIAAALFIAVALSGGAPTQGWPEKPVRFVVGFTPGGPSDILARALGQKLADS